MRLEHLLRIAKAYHALEPDERGRITEVIEDAAAEDADLHAAEKGFFAVVRTCAVDIDDQELVDEVDDLISSAKRGTR